MPGPENPLAGVQQRAVCYSRETDLVVMVWVSGPGPTTARTVDKQELRFTRDYRRIRVRVSRNFLARGAHERHPVCVSGNAGSVGGIY